MHGSEHWQVITGEDNPQQHSRKQIRKKKQEVVITNEQDTYRTKEIENRKLGDHREYGINKMCKEARP